MKAPTRKCLVCKSKFKVLSNSHWLCSVECAKVKGNEAVEKKKEQIKKKDWTREKAIIKQSLLNHADYIKLFQKVFNTFIRVRDKDLGCVSCGRMNVEEFHAGHYIATTKQYLRFNENNVWKQCSQCNTHLRGNLIPYRIELIKRIGLEEVENLENNRNKELELSIPEIKELIITYKTKIKNL